MATIKANLRVKNPTDFDKINLSSESDIIDYNNTTSGLTATNSQSAIDELASEKLDKVGDAKDTIVTFTEATTLANIVSGESFKVLWSKVMKFINFIGIGYSTLAPAYSASSTYGTGAYVIYNTKLYRCTTAITVAEAFNVAKWTESNFMEWSSLKVSSSVVAGANITVNASTLEKIGKQVFVNVQATTGATLANGGTILTIPVGYRIVGNPYTFARISNVPNAVSNIQIQGSGNVILADTALASGSQILFSYSYFTS